jgi:alpha-1,2-mannosyltransferase
MFITALFFCLWLLLGGQILLHSYDNDFLCYYIGGTMVRTGDVSGLYNPDVQMNVQRQVAPEVGERRPYIRPPWFAYALAPLTRLNLIHAYAVWISLMLAILLSLWRWGSVHFGESALVLAALFLPANLGLCFGQDSAVMLAVLCGFYAAHRKSPFMSGVILSVGLIKPHLLLLFPLWMILCGRWRMLAGFVAGASALVGAVTLAIGHDWFRNYLNLLLHGQTELGHAPDKMINVYSLAANFGIQSRLFSPALVAIILALAVLGLRNASAWIAIGIAAAGSILISPHALGYDATILLLPIWIVVTRPARKAAIYSALLLCAPVTFLATLAPQPWRCIPALAVFTFFLALVAEARLTAPDLDWEPIPSPSRTVPFVTQ